MQRSQNELRKPGALQSKGLQGKVEFEFLCFLIGFAYLNQGQVHICCFQTAEELCGAAVGYNAVPHPVQNADWAVNVNRVCCPSQQLQLLTILVELQRQVLL